MNWERDAEFRQSESPSAFSTHYLMLKPDGNRPEVREYVRLVFRQKNVLVPLQFQVRFSKDEAFRFYPKPLAWKEKYGQKRIDALVLSGHWKPGSFSCALNVGASILSEMADYLSKGPCLVYVFQTFDAERFAKRLVGDTDPATAHRESLRGKFSEDSLQAATLAERALHNIAHTPDAKDVADELALLYALKGLEEDVRSSMRAVLRPLFPDKQHVFVR